MFERLTLRGTDGTLMLGPYATAAALSGWTLTKVKREWHLAATITGRSDPFMLRQRGLLFTAPRFPALDLVDVPTIVHGRVAAILKLP